MGTRTIATLMHEMAQDHPHAYGDKSIRNRGKQVSAGSSPRVWGQVFSSTHFSVSSGIIPTRMGTSGYAVDALKTPKDHPHAYGDKLYENYLIVL